MSFIKEKHCAMCGKLIVSTSFELWAYKLRYTNKTNISYNYYCSYTCYRKAGGDDEHAKKKFYVKGKRRP